MKVIIYRDRTVFRKLRWKLIASNGKNIANGGQGYSRRIDLESSLQLALGGELRYQGEVLVRYTQFEGYTTHIPIVDKSK